MDELIANCDKLPENIKYSPAIPSAFTQEGIAMLSSVLRSPIAIQVNINIMRAFVKTRQYILESNQTAKELAELKLQLRFYKKIWKAFRKTTKVMNSTLMISTWLWRN